MSSDHNPTPPPPDGKTRQQRRYDERMQKKWGAKEKIPTYAMHVGKDEEIEKKKEDQKRARLHREMVRKQMFENFPKAK